jgi:nicotinate-nucleotide adenylyltransferase
VIGLFGGAFDPPHDGHVALVRAAKEALGIERVIVIVVADPGHKDVQTPAAARLTLARAAFPGDEVVLDEHPRTIDMLRAHPEWEGAIFLLGADEYADFPKWKEPDQILHLVQLGVAARSGHPVEPTDSDQVLFFDLDEPVTSREVRAQLDRGEDARDVIPKAVWGIIERDGLYGRRPSYTETA